MSRKEKEDGPIGLDGIPGSRLTRWSAIGWERVKADLIQHDGIKLIGGSREVRDQAWRWVRYEEDKARRLSGQPEKQDAQTSRAVVVIAKPASARRGSLMRFWRWITRR